jgi:hypothetical protein
VIDGRLGLSFTRIADPGLSYTVEVSNVAGPVTVVDSAPPSENPRRFLRLRVAY